MKSIIEVVENQAVNLESPPEVRILYSSFLNRQVKLELIDFKANSFSGKRGLLLLNDGQDLEKMRILKTTEQLSLSGTIIPTTVVCITAGERKSEYGVAGEPDYLGRGAKAGLYNNFIIHELMPFINSFTGTYFPPETTAFAGCSLGGLSALDIVISNPGYFGMAGVFSGSLWWRSKSYQDGYTDIDRIIHNKVNQTTLKNHFRCWLMAGTYDENTDRNRSGVVDAVEDTLDMFELLSEKMNDPSKNLHLRIINEGSHSTETWANHFPDFLHHCFGKHLY